jgi:succinate-acetate transporter protein
MSTTVEGAPPGVAPEAPPKYFQESAAGTPLSVWAFGFSVIMLSLANAEIVPLTANLFIPVAFGTGALGMLVGGLWDYRAGNLFGGSFGVAYACFLFTTPLLLRWFAPEISAEKVAGAGGFGDSFGAYLLVWAVFTAFLTIGAYYINLPAFLAFFLLTIVYALVGLVNITQPSSNTVLHIAGWIGIADGIFAWWVGMGIVLNAVVPKPIIPLIPYPYGRR